jgi:hypothetical protein
MGNERRQGYLKISLQGLKELSSLSDETKVLNVYRDTNDILTDTYKVLVENPYLPVVCEGGMVPQIDPVVIFAPQKNSKEGEEKKALQEQNDKLWRDVIMCPKSLVIAVAGRRSGKTTIMKRLTEREDKTYYISNGDLLCHPSLHKRFLPQKVVVGRGFKSDWHDVTLVIDEIDYTDITVVHIKELFRYGLKQCFVLGTPKSLEAHIVPKYVNEEPALTIEYVSTLLSLYFGPPAHPSIGRFFSPTLITKKDRENYIQMLGCENFQRDTLLPI